MRIINKMFQILLLSLVVFTLTACVMLPGGPHGGPHGGHGNGGPTMRH
ncbi:MULTISPECIES: hypothetical protein [Marinomonas]|uniref:Lipoprotein n=1 Tax=Marinomonas rhodophyticola TaxID=2992803 RepID=A0ABT3KBS6_9GAMM|nr:hypothetical protein [Marinomonas sp. KJ51-3]MCW4627982.1 hypothetical protein [Marinomonas sp. KJ51-3]